MHLSQHLIRWHTRVFLGTVIILSVFALPIAKAQHMENPTEPVDVVKTIFDLFNQGRVEETLQFMDENIEMFEPGPRPILPWAGTYKGIDDHQEFLKRLAESLEAVEINVHEFIAIDEKVFVIGREIGRMRATGKSYVTESVWIWRVVNGKVTKVDAFHDTYAMVRAAVK